MKWIEVQVKTTTDAEEMVANIMYDLGVTGLAIEDPKDILAFQQSEEDWDFIDPSLFKQDYEEVIIKAYFPESEDLVDKIELIRDNIERNIHSQFDKPLGQVTITEVYEKDWAESWKKYYKPTKIGERIIIKPTWEEYQKENEELIIELDPGMAFGTGTHETTVMCIEILEKYVEEGHIVYDIGTGSGILSIASAKLGAKQVIGVDLDELSVKISKENTKLNEVDHIVEIKAGNLLDAVEGKADIIVSNIIAEVIVELIESLYKHIKESGIFIASGIITEKVDMVIKALEENNYRIIEIKIMGDWATIVATMSKGE